MQLSGSVCSCSSITHRVLPADSPRSGGRGQERAGKTFGAPCQPVCASASVLEDCEEKGDVRRMFSLVNFCTAQTGRAEKHLSHITRIHGLTSIITAAAMCVTLVQESYDQRHKTATRALFVKRLPILFIHVIVRSTSRNIFTMSLCVTGTSFK